MTRNEYLAQRAQWKIDYKQLSQDIRDARQAFKDSQRVFSRVEANWDGKSKYPYPKELSTAASNSYKLQIARQDLRSKATKMLENLAALKVQAQADWEAENLAKESANA